MQEPLAIKKAGANQKGMKALKPEPDKCFRACPVKGNPFDQPALIMMMF
jgi:hypothetical protein